MHAHVFSALVSLTARHCVLCAGKRSKDDKADDDADTEKGGPKDVDDLDDAGAASTEDLGSMKQDLDELTDSLDGMREQQRDVRTRARPCAPLWAAGHREAPRHCVYVRETVALRGSNGGWRVCARRVRCAVCWLQLLPCACGSPLTARNTSIHARLRTL
jgi:hypothetical protein